MKDLFYRFIGVLVRATSRLVFSRLEIRGMDRVPWDQPCVVSPNHQNAFIDALLIGAFAPVKMTYLSRSDVFGTPFDWFLEALQMVPIYRRRDGYEKLSRNKRIFAEQREKMRDGHSLLMFSEAEHAHTYHLRSLSKGSSRFALETQKEIDRDVLLVPVGLNYYHLTHLGFKVSLVVGEPISVGAYVGPERTEAECINALRDDLQGAMKDCLLVPEKTGDYSERVDRINRKNEDLSFFEMKRALDAPEQLEGKGEPRPWFRRLARWVSPLNAGPLWMEGALQRWIDDPVFALSLKFAVAMIALPVWWLVLFGVGTWTGGSAIGAGVVGLAVLTMGLRILLLRYANPPHPVP